MKLVDLDPEYRNLEGVGRCLMFDCPVAGHRIAVPADGQVWPFTGGRWTITNGDDFAKLSITPSINDVDCWHGFITDGEVR